MIKMTKTENKDNCCESSDKQKECCDDKKEKNHKECGQEDCCQKNEHNGNKDQCCNDKDDKNLENNTNSNKNQKSEAASPEKLKQNIADLTDLLQRTQANFENYRKQTEKRVEDLKQMFSKDLLLKILPLVDNFDLAFKHNCSPADFQKGIELIYAQLMTTLEEQKVTAIEVEGKKFDPFFHEALIKVDSEKPAGTILEVFQRGFTFDGKVLRLAKVKISSGVKPSTDKNKSENKEEKNKK